MDGMPDTRTDSCSIITLIETSVWRIRSKEAPKLKLWAAVIATPQRSPQKVALTKAVRRVER